MVLLNLMMNSSYRLKMNIILLCFLKTPYITKKMNGI